MIKIYVYVSVYGNVLVKPIIMYNEHMLQNMEYCSASQTFHILPQTMA